MERKDWPKITDRMLTKVGEHNFFGIPSRIVIECDIDYSEVPRGLRGYVETAWGSSMYDWHREVPFNGFGIPIEHTIVVERTEDGQVIKTPYLKWAEINEVTCPKCRNLISEVALKSCEWQDLRDKRNMELARIQNERNALRKAHAEKRGPFEVPVLGEISEEGLIGLESGPLKALKRHASEYDYDFVDIFIANVEDDWGTLYARSIRDPDDSVASNHIHRLNIKISKEKAEKWKKQLEREKKQ